MRVNSSGAEEKKLLERLPKPRGSADSSVIFPANTFETGCSATSNSVTTPKLPPPPRMAQKRSGFSCALALTLAPISQHHGRPENVVAAEAILAHEGTDAASEKITSYADGRTLTQRGGNPCLGCLYLNRTAQCATSNAGGHFFHANGYPSEAGHV